jgi:hypothetical protein
MWYEPDPEIEYDTRVVNLKQVMMTPAIFRAVKRAGGKVKEKDYEKDPHPAPTPAERKTSPSWTFSREHP